MSSRAVRISARFRLALFGKGLLLLALALVFAALLVRGAAAPERHLLLRASAGFLFGVPCAFLGWTAVLAFADALTGSALRVTGAVALASRRNGHSLKLPDGRFAEYVLWNPWQKTLVPHAAYAVVIGRFSRVLVEPPEPEAQLASKQ